MKLLRYNSGRLGLLNETNDGVIDLTERLEISSQDSLREYIQEGYDATPYLQEPPDYDLTEVKIDAPIQRPSKVVAAPTNYEEHIAEMSGGGIRPLSYFLKAPSSIIGPSESIELPFSDRRCDHEIELAFVMDTDVKNLDRTDVMDHIFGFLILLDISVRGDEDRSNRKSYDSFTVTGPWVVTMDEIDDPYSLDLRLSVNDEVRQESNTKHLIYDFGEIVEIATHKTTIEAGDIVTTGTPDGVGPLSDEDVVRAQIEDIGELTVDVVGTDIAYDDVKIEK